MNQSLRKKIITLIIAALLVGFTVIGVPLISWVADLFREEQLRRLTLLSESIASHITEDMLNGEMKSASMLIQKFKGFPAVERVEALKANGAAAFTDLSTLNSVSARIDRDVYVREPRPAGAGLAQNDPMLQKAMETRLPVTAYDPDRASHAMLFPLLNEERCHRCHGGSSAVRGFLLVAMSTAEDQAALRALVIKLTAGFAMVMAVVAVLLWVALRRTVTEPIRELAGIARGTTPQGWPAKDAALEGRRDEIGELAQSFNQMTARLKDNYQRLERTEAFLRTVLGSIGEGVTVLDRDYRMVMTNDFVLRVLKRPREEVLGQHCYEVIHGRQERCEDCAVAETFVTGKPAFTKHTGQAKDGGVTYAELTSYPIFGADGQVEMVVEKILEVSGRVKMEEKLRQAEKLASLGALTTGLAHEVGNPLASISTVAQLIERRTAEPFTREKIALMREHISRLTRVVSDFLDYARPKGRLRERFDVAEAVRGAIQMARYDNRARKLAIVTHFDETLPAAMGAPQSFLQVCMNLILNAADATAGRDGAELSITAARENGALLVTFADNGEGMGEEEARRVFEPFFTTKRPGRGVGLGLFVSYNIMRGLDGDITVESRKGAGTVFRLRLPAAPATETAHV
ncbi:MAG: PAS domain-containing protein [Nitrospinae bacterium]|nr:PAS domain-containing protein [Nitrospinota bacterium]